MGDMWGPTAEGRAAELLMKAEKQEERRNSVLSRMGKVLIIGTGFFSYGYDLFVVNITTSLIREDYPNPSHFEITLVKGSALIGAVIGQLLFGIYADFIGRRTVFLITLSTTIVGCILCSTAEPIGSLNIWQTLGIYRFIIGLGAGGEYPLSATVASEISSPLQSAKTLSSVFSLQGFGSIFSALVPFTCLACGASNDFTWRFSFAFGAIPGLLLGYGRWRMKETPMFRRARARSDFQGHISTLRAALASPSVLHALAGTAASWFLLDITFYGNSLFNADIIKSMGFHGKGKELALRSLIIACIGCPGYFFAIIYLERVGRKRLQSIGFSLLAALFAAVAIFYEDLRNIPPLFFTIYGMTFFFSNFGPNNTTYVIPAEIFPPEIRATCHGISAACGKIGAGLATFIFLDFKTHAGLHNFFIFCACVALDGLLITHWLIPEYDATTLSHMQHQFTVTRSERVVNEYAYHDDGEIDNSLEYLTEQHESKAYDAGYSNVSVNSQSVGPPSGFSSLETRS